MKKIFELFIFLLLLPLAMLAMSCGGTRKADTQIKDSIHIENNYSQTLLFTNHLTALNLW